MTDAVKLYSERTTEINRDIDKIVNKIRIAKLFARRYRKVTQSRTLMTRIGRIFTDTANPCASASSVQSVFYPNRVNHVSAFICVHQRLNESNPIHNRYSEKWGEIYL